ncbi:phage baseplate plug family protein [Entomomonas asaccharolytica]|uniref:Cyanophage baseplate Pam3 plug gp18 domain-containing protein n=1 Tax=Entomomonas asaccharolytica TaxID=2785331 RepID=A0A974NI32_9GAMM|nr:hypothetical protein [Entomomonas asaccharolytica]QQP86948.1 hypothetical protein JHT90_06800 [Entomomonas asaccharolytica]
MRQIPVGTESPQEITINYNNERLTLTFTFSPVGKLWVFDLYNEITQQFIAQGLSLVVGIPILYRSPTDYYLWVEDESSNDVDPFSIDCLGNRCKLFIGDKQEIYEAIQQAV